MKSLKQEIEFTNSVTFSGDIPSEKRFKTSQNRQKPYEVIASCSDSRVIPEYIFYALDVWITDLKTYKAVKGGAS